MSSGAAFGVFTGGMIFPWINANVSTYFQLKGDKTVVFVKLKLKFCLQLNGWWL